MPYFKSSGEEVYYRSLGRGRAALIFVHGWYQSGSQAWGRLAPGFEDKFHVFVPDLPGHGLSPLENPEKFSTAENQQLILEFIRHVKKTYRCNKIILVGHSYGAFAVLGIVAVAEHELSGVVAMAAIDDYTPYSRRLRSVLRIPGFLIGAYYRLQAILGFFPYGDLRLLYGKQAGVPVPGKLAYAKIKNKTLSIRSSHAYIKAFLGARISWPGKKIRLPLLLVYGERDGLTSSSWAEKILPHFSAGSVSVVAEAGHNVQISGAAEVARLIGAFCEKCFRHRA
jgi:pimeloyl-ACP methyl ester carboxylesterase